MGSVTFLVSLASVSVFRKA